MKAILDFLNDNQGALMVLITTVYVIATVVITCANIKAAKATRAQIAESRRQYEDKKRLEIMPFIQFETTRAGSFNHVHNILCPSPNGIMLKSGITPLQMKNIGLGTAKDIKYSFRWEDGLECCENEAFPVQALFSNENQTIKIITQHPVITNKELTGAITFSYRDLLDNEYKQELELQYSQGSTLFTLQSLSVSSPIQIKKENENA